MKYNNKRVVILVVARSDIRNSHCIYFEVELWILASPANLLKLINVIVSECNPRTLLMIRLFTRLEGESLPNGEDLERSVSMHSIMSL